MTEKKETKEKTKLRKVVYAWGDQVRGGRGKLVFFTTDLKLLYLNEDEVNNYQVEGTIEYDHAYNIKRGKIFPSFRLQDLI